MKRTYSRVKSFPSPKSDISSPLSNPFDQSFVSNIENLHKLQGSRISADDLFKILDASMVSQKMGMNVAMDAINPTTCSESDWRFINYFLDSTMLLLDACNNIQVRLKSIKNCLDSIPIGLHCLEGEHEPSKAILQQAARTLESSRFKDKRFSTKMDKSLSWMRTFGKRLNGRKLAYEDTRDSVISKVYKDLSGSWAMSILAIEVLCSATTIRSLTNPSVQHLKVEPQTMLLNEPDKKIKKKSENTASMEELVGAELAAQTLLKLISSWQKDGSSSLRRMAVKAVAGELRRRKQVLEKILPLLEEKIEMFYQQIVAIRINIFGLLRKAHKEEAFEMLKHSSYEEIQMDANHAQYQRDVARAKVQTKVSTRSKSLARVRPPIYINFKQNRVPNQVI
ncbi:hypothetical protein IEQ34_018404 [Dendrobium chrysotoxum]|uniref:Uncharacterized protein n=1 Tax=Dendrobium chrysotoxum TaxID=161865 RepID=A0AAV7FWF5_DENCH|nr:hypothetical protein IEQ34_018404 [Dendrobium chrysotoxum]